jgi:signal peptidase I
LAVAAALLCLQLVVHSRLQLALVVGNSMLPTLTSGDLLLVDKWAYKKADPHRGDVVVIRYAKELIVKRIVGLAGEEVEVKQGTLYINGAPCPETYITEPGSLAIGKGRLLKERFASLGDNRAVSPALAIHPIVSKSDILGKVVCSVRLWPKSSVK